MRGKIVFAAGSLFIFLLSCSSHKSNRALLSEIDSSIIESNKHINVMNEDVLHTFQSLRDDPRTKYKAEIWLPVVMQIKTITTTIGTYIDTVKTHLLQNSNNKDAVQKLFIEKSEGHALFNKLKQYKVDLLNTNERLRTEFESYISFFKIENASSDPKSFTNEHFSSSSTEETILFLSSLQNNIFNNEHKCLLFCLQQIAYHGHVDEMFQTIVGQNAKILKAGDELEITAGLGAFSRTKLPEIKIGSVNVPLNEKGFVVYKFKTQKRTGNHSIPVTVEFLDQDGKKQFMSINVEYTLVDTLKK